MTGAKTLKITAGPISAPNAKRTEASGSSGDAVQLDKWLSEVALHQCVLGKQMQESLRGWEAGGNDVTEG